MVQRRRQKIYRQNLSAVLSSFGAMAVSPSVYNLRADVFVRAVMSEVGARGPTELARCARFDPYTDFRRKIQTWLAGENQPNFESTMRLLSAAGWLDEEKLDTALRKVGSKPGA